MGWLSDTIVNNTEVNTIEARIIAGAVVILVAILMCYICLKAHGKYTKAKTRQQVQHEIRLNNINGARLA